MAHELTVNKITGKVEFFYVAGDGPAWHQLGNPVSKAATSKVAIKEGGLDWTVALEPIYVQRGQLAATINSHRAVVRSDTNDVIGVVGSDYHPTQNHELFDFCDALVGEAAAMYHTAGSIRGGSRVWALAKLPKNLVVVPGDEVEKYFLISNGHDGSYSVTARFTTIRVVCANTLSAALAEQGVKWQMKVRHTKNVRSRVEEARNVLKIGLRYFDVLGQKFQALAATKINDLMAQKYFEAVVPMTKNADGDESTRIKKTHEVLAYLYAEGRNNVLPGVKGTLWAALNAVTEYVDHVRGVKRDGTPRASWAEAALFGSGHVLKQRAFDTALTMVGGKRKAA